MDLKKSILDLLFPIECAGCGQEDVWLCTECRAKMLAFSRSACFACGQANQLGETCPACQNAFPLNGVFVIGDYQERALKSLIKTAKYGFAREAAAILGGLAVSFCQEPGRGPRALFAPPGPLLLPIPLHRRRQNWRGFNQAEIIARALEEGLSWEISTDLIRTKHKTPQAKLSGEERRKNISGCFSWKGGDLKRRGILLVDDVATTGSTLAEAARALKNGGAGKIWGLVIGKG